MCVTLKLNMLQTHSTIGHTSSKNRNQFCSLSSALISLLLVPSLCSCSLYFTHFLNRPTSIRLTFCCIYLSSVQYIPLSLSLSPPAVSPDVCCNSALWIYTALTGSMASSGCHSAAPMGPQFTMSIGSQVSACHFHSWGEEKELFKCGSTLCDSL